MLPRALQRHLYEVYHDHQTQAQRMASYEYLSAVAQAVELIARQEGRASRNVFRGLAAMASSGFLQAAAPRESVAPTLLERACTSKRRYDTFTQADQAIHTLARRSNDVRNMSAYACRNCGGFHFGHAAGPTSGRARIVR